MESSFWRLNADADDEIELKRFKGMHLQQFGFFDNDLRRLFLSNVPYRPIVTHSVQK